MASIGRAIKELRPESHVIIPPLPLTRTSLTNPLEIVRNLLATIEDQIAFRKKQGWADFDDIILIGHSMGALLAEAPPFSLSYVCNG
jgi:pimeloyl-ACP methyl ester carboxylesterase